MERFIPTVEIMDETRRMAGERPVVFITAPVIGTAESTVADVSRPWDRGGRWEVVTFDPHTSRYRTTLRATLAGAQAVLDRHADALHVERVDITTIDWS